MLNYKHGEQKSIQECIEPTERQATKAEDHPEIEMLSILGKLARVPICKTFGETESMDQSYGACGLMVLQFFPLPTLSLTYNR